MRTVIAAVIGSFSTDIVIEKCKESGARVIGCGVYPRGRIADAGNVEVFYQVPYATDTGHCIGIMMSLCWKGGAEAVIPLTDAEIDVSNLHRDEFSEIDVALCMSDRACIGPCRDKMELYHYLGEHMGGTVIPTLHLGDTDPDEIGYPAVCKPYNGRNGQGLKMVGPRREMEGVLGKIDSADYIVQPMIKGNVVTVDAIRNPEQDTCAVICHRELLRIPNGAGTSVLVFRDRQLEERCWTTAELLGIRGCVSMEFIGNRDGVYHMLECNPRFSGGVEFSCLAGYDCVTNHLRCLEGEEIGYDGSVIGMYTAREYKGYITKVEWQGGVTGYERQGVRQCRAANRRYNYNGQHQLCYI